MTRGTFAVLVVLWAAVLVPGMVRDWRRSPVATADHFAEAMRRLGGGDDRNVVVPGSARRSIVHPPDTAARRLRRRRLQVLQRLVVVALAAVAVALVAGGPVPWVVAGLAVTALLGYVVMLRLLAVRARAARDVVPLHPARRPRRRAPAAGTPRPARVVAGGEWP